MATFPRTVLPSKTTPFGQPGPLQSWAQAGKVQQRNTLQMGRWWQEEYGILKLSDPVVRGWLAVIMAGWMDGTVWDISHQSYLTRAGGGTGSPVVSGGSQSGTSLVTSGWGGSAPYLKAGDIIRVAGLNQVLDITADASTMTLAIHPGIPVGGSPANGAAITYNAVLIRAVLDAPPDLPLSLPANGFVAGLRLSFREAV